MYPYPAPAPPVPPVPPRRAAPVVVSVLLALAAALPLLFAVVGGIVLMGPLVVHPVGWAFSLVGLLVFWGVGCALFALARVPRVGVAALVPVLFLALATGYTVLEHTVFDAPVTIDGMPILQPVHWLVRYAVTVAAAAVAAAMTARRLERRRPFALLPALVVAVLSAVALLGTTPWAQELHERELEQSRPEHWTGSGT